MAHEYEGNMVNEFLVSECEDELSALRARVARLEDALRELATLYWETHQRRKKCAESPVAH